MARHEIKIADLLTGAASLDLTPGERHVVVLRRKRTFFGVTYFRNASAVLLPSNDGPSCDGKQHAGLDMVAASLAHARNHPDRKLLVTGHTDTVDTDQKNDILGKYRAEATHGMLAGLRDQFADACYGHHLPASKRFPPQDGSYRGTLESDENDVLEWIAAAFGWPCAPSTHPTLSHAVVDFKKNYNKHRGELGGSDALTTSVVAFDVPTWRAIYDCYNFKLAEMLGLDAAGLNQLRGSLQFVSPSAPLASCGERQPVENVGVDNYPSASNRRAEILLFPPGDEPAIPCLGGACNPLACELYVPGWFRRKRLPPTIGELPARTMEICVNVGPDYPWTEQDQVLVYNGAGAVVLQKAIAEGEKSGDRRRFVLDPCDDGDDYRAELHFSDFKLLLIG